MNREQTTFGVWAWNKANMYPESKALKVFKPEQDKDHYDEAWKHADLLMEAAQAGLSAMPEGGYVVRRLHKDSES